MNAPRTASSRAIGYTSPARRPSVPCCSACTTTRRARLGRRHRRFPDGTPQGAVRRATAVRHHVRWPSLELGGPRGRRTDTAEERERAAGTPARTCRSSRCARSGWSRCGTTTWRAPASGTPRSSCRWRPDRDPESCTYDQLDRAGPFQPRRRPVQRLSSRGSSHRIVAGRCPCSAARAWARPASSDTPAGMACRPGRDHARPARTSPAAVRCRTR